ncbi:MAG: lipid A deacylase LpxR family protein [Parvularculaceae bacterium]|nr:lipid A deacylase LpxR family protein [Parvularculaceae bacterium]
MGDEHLHVAARRALAWTVVSLGLLGMAHADDSKRDRGTFTYTLENDWFGGQDRNYTNGFRYAYVGAATDPFGWERRLIRDEKRQKSFRRGFAFAQTIYTPDNIFTPDNQPDDHPYVGYLYGEYSAMAEKDDIVDIVTVELGVVGPWALGQELQSWYHEATDRDAPEGWDNQHPNEVVFGVSYDRKAKPVFGQDAGFLTFEVTPSYGFSVGTMAINARAGAIARLGNRKGSDFGPARIRPSLTGSGHFSMDQPAAWYIFLGLQTRGVVHDLSLDGSLFQDDAPSVDKRIWVRDLQYGYAVQLGRLQVAWTSVRRTERFVGQEGPDRFGAISVSLKF